MKKTLLNKQLLLFAIAIFLSTALIVGNVLMLFSWGTGVAVNTLAAGNVKIRLLESNNSTDYHTVGDEYDPLTEQHDSQYDYNSDDIFTGLSWTDAFRPDDGTQSGSEDTVPKFARIENIGEGEVYLKVAVTFDFTDISNLAPGENLYGIFNILMQNNCPAANWPAAGFNPAFVYKPLETVIAGNTYTATFYYVSSGDSSKLETLPNDGSHIQFLNGLFLHEDLIGLSCDNGDGTDGYLPLEVSIRAFAVQTYYNNTYVTFNDAFKGHGF